MLKFISFGSGSSGNCYCLFTETDGLMIDAGLGVRTIKKYFHEYGLSFTMVHNIIVTHDHADHIKSVGSLSRSYEMPVYATQTVHQGIVRNYCVRSKIPESNKRIIEKNVPFRAGDFDITAFNVPHDSSDNVGYQIKYGDTVFSIMTDAGHVTEEMADIIGKSDYLVLESNYDEDMLRDGPYPEYLKKRIRGDYGHLCNNDCAAALATNASERLRHVWLCHLSEENNHLEIARKTVEHVLETSETCRNRDFILDVLKRKSPNGMYELI